MSGLCCKLNLRNVTIQLLLQYTLHTGHVPLSAIYTVPNLNFKISKNMQPILLRNVYLGKKQTSQNLRMSENLKYWFPMKQKCPFNVLLAVWNIYYKSTRIHRLQNFQNLWELWSQGIQGRKYRQQCIKCYLHIWIK